MAEKPVKIVNRTKNTVLAERAEIADSPFSRMKGLLGRSGLSQGEALIITKCSSIHTFFMKFAIDVVFLDKKGMVVAVGKSIGKWSLFSTNFKGNLVIELPINSVEETNTEIGDLIEICKI